MVPIKCSLFNKWIGETVDTKDIKSVELSPHPSELKSVQYLEEFHSLLTWIAKFQQLILYLKGYIHVKRYFSYRFSYHFLD